MRFVNFSLPARTAATALFSICLFTVLPFISSGFAATERQVIYVHFSIEGQRFENLPAPGRARIEAEVAEKFSIAAETQWGFIDWSPGPPPSANAFEWKITLNLETRNLDSDGGGISTGYIVTLDHSGRLGDQLFSFTQTEENETIYPLGSYFPSQNAEHLGNDISKQLDKQLGVLLQSLDVKTFLQQVPIVNEVIAEETRIVIPVSIRELRSKDDSVLDVTFTAENSQTGHLTMQTAAEVKDGGQYDGYVIGYVTALQVFPLIIATPLWAPPAELSAVINTASDVRVYMITYSPSLAGSSATVGDLILDPDM